MQYYFHFLRKKHFESILCIWFLDCRPVSCRVYPLPSEIHKIKVNAKPYYNQMNSLVNTGIELLVQRTSLVLPELTRLSDAA